MDVRAALAARAGGSIDADTYCRALVEHRGWCVPLVDDRALVITLEGDVKVMFVFTDAEAVAACAEKMPALREHLARCQRDVEGDHIFGHAERNPGFGVWVNPGSQPSCRFDGEHLEPMFAWARTVEVERALTTPPEGSRFCRVLKAYAAYQVGFLLGETPEGLVKALLRMPFGPANERYVPVFTAEDHRDAWISAGRTDPSVIAFDTLDGARLFAFLRDSGMDGIIFNPNLENAPTFRIDVCEYILDGG